MKTAMVSFGRRTWMTTIFSLWCTLSVLAGTTYTVNTLTDVATGTGTSGSLRYCITTANATAGATAAAPHIITFSVAGTITLTSNLPTITRPTYINGTTAPAYAFWVPKVQLTGFSLLFNNTGGADSRIRGLVLSNANPHGIDINGVNNLMIEECFIGTNLTGTAVATTAAHGIIVQNASGTVIKNNIISGSGAHGIIAINSSAMYIIGNHIGCNAAGGAALANGAFGILLIDNCSNTQIGGFAGGATDSSNVISGNNQVAIGLQGSAKSTIKIIRNTIGLTKAGNAALGNQFAILDNSSTTNRLNIINNYIGATTAQGIYIEASTNVVIRGNYIGTNKAGTASIPTGENSLDLNGTHGTLIGGSAAGQGNVFGGTSGPGKHAIVLQGASRTNNCIIYGNYIGTNASGTAITGGGVRGYGIALKGSNNIIGGTGAGEANIISGCAQVGVLLTDGNSNQVVGNKIGVDINNAALGNGYAGVIVRREDPAFPTVSNVIRNNVIAYNGFTYPTNPVNATWIAPAKGPGIGISVAEYGTSNTNAIQHQISQNSIYCNAGLGISLNKTEPTPGYGNNNKAEPVINAASDNVTTFGTAAPGDVVEVYGNPTNCGCQGEVYLGSATANASGNWTLTHANYDYLKITATARATNNNTSQFTACIDPSSLPVEYLSFHAYNQQNGTALLVWQTASEEDNAYFTVEKSTNGVQFTAIGTQQGAGTTAQVQSYSFVDPFFTTAAYYRIKQTDLDGEFSYSIVRYLDLNNTGDISMYPNPAGGEVTLSGIIEQDATVSVSLRNALSQEVFHQQYVVQGNLFDQQLNITALTPGIYMVTVLTGNKSYVLKLVKE